jgi:hypothetical protein
VYCGYYFFILLAIIVRDESKARKHLREKASVKVQREKKISAVKLTVSVRIPVSLFAWR